jgi:phosphoribosyl 1,2-cyclic phosphate phosphodiesterase
MRAQLLGTGTSSGVPLIGCDCAVCKSADPRNRRRRTCLHLEAGGVHIQVDTPPDFREQALEYGVEHIDAVLFTHAHADHVFGFDDIRRFNTIQKCVIPAYADASTLADLRRIFDYISTDKIPGFYRPQIDFKVVESPFRVGDVEVTPLPVEHGPKPTFGFRFDADGSSLAYVPDCKSMPEGTIDLIRGVDVMLLDALRYREHMTHMTIDESVALLQQIGAGQSYLVHLCHNVDHASQDAKLPEGINVSYDGMKIIL